MLYILISLFNFILDALLIFNLINNFFYLLKLIIINKFKNLYKDIRRVIVIANIIRF